MPSRSGSPAEKESQVVELGEGHDLAWVVGVWGRVLGGLALAATGGVAFGHAWAQQSTQFWILGGVTLLAGALLVLSWLYARSGPRQPEEDEAPVSESEQPGEQRDVLVPLLGALLIYKYQLITHGQLNEALTEQRKSEPRQLLGEILVEKKLITRAQLDRALQHQREHFRMKQRPRTS